MRTRQNVVKALLVVDVQRDFVPGGALAVKDGDKVVPVINRLQQLFEIIVATQDWHPLDHASFAVNHPGKKPGDQVIINKMPQTLWPVHCVQETPGADFVPGLHTSRFAEVIRKGADPKIDSYSGFFDNHRQRDTGLNAFLKSRFVDEVYIAGLTTDYCVKFTAFDAVTLGYKTHVIQDACRAVNLVHGDEERAYEDMRLGGVTLLRSH